MGTHDSFFKTMDAQLKQWDTEVDRMTAASEKAGAEMRDEYQEQIKALRVDRDAAYKKMREMRAAGEAATLEMKSAVDVAWQSMKKSLDRAASNLKSR